VSPEVAGPGPTPEPARTVLVPPYPNLGPEPMARAWTDAFWPLATGVGFLLIVAVVLGRHLRATRRARAGAETGILSDDASVSDRERIIARSREVRAALVARFGPQWLAKTTEEVAAALAPGGVLPVELAARLQTFLDLADLAKFGGDRFDVAVAERVAQRGPIDADAWCATLVDDVAVAAGARSTISGK
jgi:hypothetical protein